MGSGDGGASGDGDASGDDPSTCADEKKLPACTADNVDAGDCYGTVNTDCTKSALGATTCQKGTIKAGTTIPGSTDKADFDATGTVCTLPAACVAFKALADATDGADVTCTDDASSCDVGTTCSSANMLSISFFAVFMSLFVTLKQL